MKSHVPHKDGKPVHLIKADYLKPVIEKYKDDGKPFKQDDESSPALSVVISEAA